MKKLLCILLALCLMLTAFVGCGKKESTEEKGDNIKDNIEDIHSDANKTEIGKVDMSLATATSAFKNGIAYVRYGTYKDAQEQEALFIDKKGNILFRTKEYYVINEPLYTDNGVTVLEEKNSVNFVLCDIKANRIYTASDLGGTNIPYNALTFQKAFNDGYIFVEKIETTYDGSTKKLAIYNDELELVCDFSEELYSFIVGDIGSGFVGIHYYEGNIYPNFGEKYYSIANGDFVIDSSKVEYYSNYYEWSVVEGKYNTLSYHTEFSNNLAGVIFQSEDKYFYSIVDINGNLLFDPIQVSGELGRYGKITGTNGEYAIGSVGEDSYHIETFNKKGRIASIDIPINVESSFETLYLYCGDGVVSVGGSLFSDEYYFYNMDGTELF